MKWTKPNGAEIESNDLPTTTAYCQSLGWVSEEPILLYPTGRPQTENVSALEIDNVAIMKAFEATHGAIPEEIEFIDENEFNVEYDGDILTVDNYADALSAVEGEKKRLADLATEGE